jgi:hypothetical protein
VLLLFANAVMRLGARGVAAMRGGLEPFEWAALGALTVLFVYGEGVRALQRRWVPHVIARIRLLRSSDVVRHHLLGPLYAMSLVGAPRRTMVLAWTGLAAIAGAVFIVSRFADPWRGITDFAVGAALAWAMGALIVHGRALREP